MPQTVLIFGATGATGGSIANAVLGNPNFSLIAAIRAASASKPAVTSLKERGAQIVHLELTSPKEELLSKLKGIDTVIVAVPSPETLNQIYLIDAAKEAGVKRFVPCDWGYPGPRGVVNLVDRIRDIDEHIEKIGLGHTFINVGWWYEIIPGLKSDNAPHQLPPFPFHVFGDGDVKNVWTCLPDIGRFVARIIADPSTLNKRILIPGENLTHKEIYEIYKQVFPEKQFELVFKPASFITESLASAPEKPHFARLFWQYMYSMFVRGDNSLENWKKAYNGEALDARELYPDVPVTTLAEHGKKHWQ